MKTLNFYTSKAKIAKTIELPEYFDVFFHKEKNTFEVTVCGKREGEGCRYSDNEYIFNLDEIPIITFKDSDKNDTCSFTAHVLLKDDISRRINFLSNPSILFDIDDNGFQEAVGYASFIWVDKTRIICASVTKNTITDNDGESE